MHKIEEITNHYYREFVIQQVGPSTYEVYGPKQTNEAGKVFREQVGLVDSLAGAKEVADCELSGLTQELGSEV